MVVLFIEIKITKGKSGCRKMWSILDAWGIRELVKMSVRLMNECSGTQRRCLVERERLSIHRHKYGK